MGMSKQIKHLTHEEIWDDSALLRSWDDAVEEYRVRCQSKLTWPLPNCWWQLYHSIQAKGENVEDVLRQAEEAGLADEDDPLAAEEDAAGDGFIAETEEETATGSASQVCKSKPSVYGPYWLALEPKVCRSRTAASDWKWTSWGSCTRPNVRYHVNAWCASISRYVYFEYIFQVIEPED